MQRPGVEDLLETGAGGEPSTVVAGRVAAARQVALDRSGRLNAALDGPGLDEHAPLTMAARATLRSEIERDRLTGRGYHRIRRVARTIADLAGTTSGSGVPEHVDVEHVEVALSLRTRLRAATQGLVA